MPESFLKEGNFAARQMREEGTSIYQGGQESTTEILYLPTYTFGLISPVLIGIQLYQSY